MKVVESLHLKDLNEHILSCMIMAKIIASLLPSYNSVIAAWVNVPLHLQTTDILEEWLIHFETLMKIQGGVEDAKDKAFFTRSAELYRKNQQM